MASVVRVDTFVVGNKLDLMELEITSGVGTGFPNRAVPYASLVTTTVTDFLSIPENNAANTITVLGTPDAPAPVGADRLGLLGDQHLNTGIFNPSSVTTGIHVQFSAPIVNGPGEDFVAFELTIGAGQTPDPMIIRQLAGVGLSRSVITSHYQLSGVIPAEATPNTYLSTVEQGGATDFAELSTTALVNNSAVTNPKWYVVPIDLTWLGVPAWQSVETLEILSGDATRAVDLLMVVGLAPVTSPGDFDHDLDVDGADYQIWRQQFGTVENVTADGNGDGVVDAGDYVIWRHSFGYGGGTSFVAVPEPFPRWTWQCLAVMAFVDRRGSTRESLAAHRTSASPQSTPHR